MPSKDKLHMQSSACLYHLTYKAALHGAHRHIYAVSLAWHILASSGNSFARISVFSFEELKLDEPTWGLSEWIALIGTALHVASHKMHFLLVWIQTDMWNYNRNEKLKQQMMEGKSWRLGQSCFDLTGRLHGFSGCMLLTLWKASAFL